MAARTTGLLAKLTRPKLYRVLARQRLFALLDARLQRGSAWISGPPGAGKTALAASYIEARGLKHVWYQLDAGDDDLASFFHYLTRALNQCMRGIRLPTVQPERLAADQDAFVRDYFRAAFNRFQPPGLLVFDNYHELPKDSRLHRALELAASESPSGTALLFISREEPPAQFARLQVSERLFVIDWDALRLSQEEGHAIASLRDTFTPQALSEIFALSQGWVAGLTLALERMKHTADDATSLKSSTFETVFNYFASQILQTVAPDVQEFLMRSAVVRHLSPAIAQRIAGNSHATQILEEFHRRRLFVDRRGEKAITYQYHDLFRAFLLRELERTHAQNAIDELKTSAAQLLEHTGDTGEAVLLLQQVRDWASVARLIKAHAELMIDQGRWQTLQTWFEGMPEQVLSQDADLLLWSGMSHVGSDPRKARELLTRADNFYKTAGNASGMVRAAHTLSDLTFILDGSLEQLRSIKTVLEQVAAPGVQLPAAVQRQAYAAYLDIATVMGGHHALTEQTLAAAQEQLRSASLSNNQRININHELVLYSVFAADERLGGDAHASLRQLQKCDDAAPTSLFFAIRHLGFWRYFRGEPDYGLSDFNRAIELADHWNMGLQSVVARVYRILASCRSGQLSVAQDELPKLIETSAGMGAFRDGYVGWAQSIVAVGSGDLVRALDYASAAASAMRGASFPIVELICCNLQAACALRLGRDALALSYVRAARTLIEHSTWRRYDAHLLSVEAETEWRAGRQDEAARLIGAMLPLTRNRLVAAALLEDSDWVPRQLAFALQNGIEAETAQALIHGFKLAPPSALTEHWPWPLRIFALGRFEVRRHGAPLIVSRKAPRKPYALLKLLVCQGGNAMSATRVIDALWPESGADAAKKSFDMALMRLRGLLGDPELVALENGMLGLNRDAVWVDAWAFGAHVGAGNTQSAAELYTGGLLPDETDTAWTVSYREHLRDTFNRLIREAAAKLEAERRYTEALELYIKGIEADDLVEAMHQGMMRCQISLGRRADALAAFQRLRRTLSAKLRTLPSPESTALASQAQSI